VVLLGGKPVFFMASPAWGPTLYVLSDVWQTMGYNAIIFLAALSGVDLSAKEAAFCDGAGRLQIICRIEIPWIAPTIVILFIMRLGHLFTVGFEKVLLMQNDLNVATMEVISTYVYRSGILDSQYDYAAAVGLLETVLNFVILLASNRFAKRMGQASLW
jgi:putative aldouronate transport system permease protein